MTHIRKNIFIDAPIEKVYAFARDPERWNTWFTNLSVPETLKGKGEVGTMVKHHYTIAGIPFPITTRVLLDKPGPKNAEFKTQIEGPLDGTQDWQYTAKNDGTDVVVMVDYTVPGKALGKFADRLLIERMQEKAFEHTLENLKLFCEAEVAIPVTR
jgi:uncharacterized membrane protein